MPSKTPSKKQVESEVKEEAMEVESTAPEAKTPKRNAQAKLSSFFGSAAKGKNLTGDGSTVSGSSGLKSPKKEEPESPVKSLAKRKSAGGKKKVTEKKEKKGKAAPKEAEIKEEPMDEEEGSETGSEQYEVEKIVGHNWTRGELKFKVKWVGYAEESMEPEDHLEAAKDLIEEYLQNLPKKAKDEYERRTGENIESPVKGAKKRPISETLSTPSSTANKKGKNDESEKRKSAGGSKQGTKKNVLKTPNARVKKEPINAAERIAVIEKTRQNAFDYSAEDHIGKVIQKATEGLLDMIRSNADPQKITTVIESIKNEREVCLEADRKSGVKDPARDAAYALCEKLEQTLTFVAAREKKLAEMKKEQQDAGDDAVSLMAMSKVVDGIEVKEEVNETLSEVKTEGVEAQ